MILLIGSLTIGLILSLLAFGSLISFKIFSFPDITADGSITLGAAVAATLIVNGYSPVFATIISFLAGFLAGTITGILHTKFKINGLLSGILVMTALYSINLHIMGRSNIPLLNQTTLFTIAQESIINLLNLKENIFFIGWEISNKDISTILFIFTIVVLFILLLFWFFKTNLGTSMRATGNNPQMIRALGVNTKIMLTLGIGLSNAMIALSGSLLAQYQGFADVQMGIGIIVIGLASVIIGNALVNSNDLFLLIAGTVVGAVLFRLLVAIALRWGMNPNDLKLVTAVFVFIALILPDLIKNFKNRRKKINA